MAQTYATRLASKTPDGAAFRQQVGLNVPNLDPPPPVNVGPGMTKPAPLGDASVGYTADDPRRQQELMRRAGAASTIIGTKLG